MAGNERAGGRAWSRARINFKATKDVRYSDKERWIKSESKAWACLWHESSRNSKLKFKSRISLRNKLFKEGIEIVGVIPKKVRLKDNLKVKCKNGHIRSRRLQHILDGRSCLECYTKDYPKPAIIQQLNFRLKFANPNLQI